MLDDLIDALERRRHQQLARAYVELALALGALGGDDGHRLPAVRWHLGRAAGILSAEVGMALHQREPDATQLAPGTEPAFLPN